MATNNKRLEITEFDFDDVKDNLKTFLGAQTEFTDYDFEGSGMSALLDVLAYNTHYLGFNANMLANEMFLDSASLRSSIVSHAKTLGYVPTSARASKAKVDEVAAKIQSKTDAAVATKAVAKKVDPEPQTAYPSVYSGSIILAGIEIPDNAVLTAKIGDYISPPAIISGNSFQNLVISPGNSTYIDKPIIFMLNNVESEPILELYKPGLTKDLKLIFVGLPIETKVNEEPKQISSSPPSSPPSPSDTSSGSNCSFVSSNNNKNYSGAISLALMLLVPLIAFKSTKNK